MKTKIIYISGGETFEMTQIRAAFEEVRNTLGLGNDTVLFGVPVDCDNAIEVTDSDECVCNTDVIADVANQEIIDNTQESTEIEPDFEEIAQPEIIIPEQKEEIITPETKPEIEEVAIENHDEEVSDKVIPILSVLASKSEEPEQIIEQDVAPIEEDVVAEVIPEPIKENIEQVTVAEAQIENIDEIIDEEAPSAPMEKTLEQLLEKMAPLREDVQDNATIIDDNSDTLDTDANFIDEDTDATLAQLASEFAQTEDKIVTPTKTESHGKIGKLKNILPFKKAKRDDNGLMGDLFGWAGIAANDDDFSMPGFFTQARKQGS